tara:strand:+ start:1844 stop:2077 length:234 start_codon:yes stop_codon:yes gene_type:complete
VEKLLLRQEALDQPTERAYAEKCSPSSFRLHQEQILGNKAKQDQESLTSESRCKMAAFKALHRHHSLEDSSIRAYQI